jgi:hypothetical protein
MKIYAEQVPPEHQESPLFYGDFPENVYIYGNRDYKTSNKIKTLLDDIDTAAGDLHDLQRGYYKTCKYSLIEILYSYLPRDDGRAYTRGERLRWRALLLNYYSGVIRDDDALEAALELITGEKYSAAELRGCCQGEWTNILYPEEYGREWLREFEIEFFNMGEEWRVYTDDDSDGFYMYTHNWRDDEKRAEIADAAGADPGDVVLYEFSGWTRTPNYKEVGA